MKKFLVVIIVAFYLINFRAVNEIHAHEIESDDSVIATFHIEPNDNPIAGNVSEIKISFFDRVSEFDATKCDCDIAISSNGIEIFRKPVGEIQGVNLTNNSIVFPYIFQEKGSYTLALSGKINQGDGDTQDVNHDFSIEINQTVGESISFLERMLGLLKGHTLHIILFGSAIIISLYVIVTDKPKNNV